MPYSFVSIPDWVFDQVLTFTIMNTQKDNIDNTYNSFSTEHNFSDGMHKNIRQASGNVADVPPPAPYGGGIIHFEKTLNVPAGGGAGNTTYAITTIDNSIDWRDRWVRAEVLCAICTPANVGRFIPGGAEDDRLWWQRSYIDGFGVDESYYGFSSANADREQTITSHGYTEAGNAASSAKGTGSRWHIAGATYSNATDDYFPVLFVDSTDGFLKMEIRRFQSGGAGTVDYAFVFNGMIQFTSDEGHI